ncbi:MAG TPA: hypothetical protein VEQ11_13710, partial [Chloroflexota bacterium]|nr:hypothetical protein [Chloroflexota bacterium]
AQARSESLLAVLTVLALIGAMVVARRFGERGEVPALGWLAGLALGLALATKLTAALAVVGTGAYGGAAMLNRWVGEARERQRMAAWTVVTGASAAVVFLVVNPFLWPDPVARTFSMLDQQQAIMREQGQQFGGATTGDSWARGALVIRRTFVENSIPAFDAGLPPGSEPVVQKTFLDLPAPGGLSLELALSAIGLLALCWRAARSWRPGERLGGETALLCWLAAYFAGIAGYLSLDWPRYYVPTAFLGSLLIGLAVGALARGALDLFLDRTPMGAAAQRPAPTGLRYRSRVWR